eukprot:GEMP01005155.1.p1 GENE.GEMP01005155.1~~GEMP01005155.1.p1  ORF type:complete len:434 (-),score=126.15 GEMP01005155.1:2550-3851(-)
MGIMASKSNEGCYAGVLKMQSRKKTRSTLSDNDSIASRRVDRFHTVETFVSFPEFPETPQHVGDVGQAVETTRKMSPASHGKEECRVPKTVEAENRSCAVAVRVTDGCVEVRVRPKEHESAVGLAAPCPVAAHIRADTGAQHTSVEDASVVYEQKTRSTFDDASTVVGMPLWAGDDAESSTVDKVKDGIRDRLSSSAVDHELAIAEKVDAGKVAGTDGELNAEGRREDVVDGVVDSKGTVADVDNVMLKEYREEEKDVMVNLASELVEAQAAEVRGCGVQARRSHRDVPTGFAFEVDDAGAYVAEAEDDKGEASDEDDTDSDDLGVKDVRSARVMFEKKMQAAASTKASRTRLANLQNVRSATQMFEEKIQRTVVRSSTVEVEFGQDVTKLKKVFQEGIKKNETEGRPFQPWQSHRSLEAYGAPDSEQCPRID